MFAFVLTDLAPWEVVAFSGLCALSALTIATVIGVTVAYLATGVPGAARRSAPARVAQPQPQATGAIDAIPNLTGATG